MGTDLVLVVPENEQNEQTVRAYYEYVLEKKRTIRPEAAEESVEDLSDYQFTQERLNHGDELFISERLFSDVSDIMDWEPVKEMFGLDESWDNSVIRESRDLKNLIEVLRDAKEQLESEEPELYWDYNLETQVIALCEFALEHGYGVRLSLG